MDEFNPIGDVGRTLRSLLQEGMGSWSVDDHQIALVSPDQFDPDEVGLSLHLYHLTENPHLRNDPPAAADADRPGGSPLVLELYYLLTAHPPDGETIDTSDTLEQHRILSKAIQTFGERSIVGGPDLEGSLAGGDPLHITIDTEATDHVLDVWSSFRDTPYLPSVSYVVTPVVIETADEEVSPRVVESRMEYFEQRSEPSSRGRR